MLSRRSQSLRVMGLAAVAVVLGSALLGPPAFSSPSGEDLRRALLTNKDVPDYNRFDVTKPEARTYWCNTYVDNPFTAGIRAEFAGRGRFEDQRWLTEDLYAYKSARAAQGWFTKQRNVGRSCSAFTYGTYRYSRIHKATPPHLRGASQISALRYRLHVQQSSWTNHFLEVTIRDGAWTQIVSIAEKSGPPPKARSGQLVREAYHKAVVKLN